jgi:opacity protein-like surface antigen
VKCNPRLHHCALIAAAFATTIAWSTAIASDWYIRGGLGYERSEDADFSDADCTSTTPPALFGCVRGNGGKPIGAYGDFGGGASWELAVGRSLLPWLRSDLSVTYRPDLDFDGNANFLGVGGDQPVSGELESWAGMLNLFADLHPLTEADLGIFEPYLGVGIGVSRNDLGRLRFRFPENPGRHRYSIVPSGEHWDLAYTLTIGTGIRIGDSTTLDVAFRYSDLGEVRSDRGRMAMNTIPDGIVIDRIETNLRTNGLSVGLRYRF